MKNSMLLVVGLAGAALAGCGDRTDRRNTDVRTTPSASVQGEGTSKLTLDKPSDVTLRRGEMRKIDVRVRRHDMPGDVTIAFSDLPAGVDVVELSGRLMGG